MKTRLKKMVMKRKGLCDLVVGAARVQGPAIGGALGEYLSPVLAPDETLPDFRTPIELYSRRLEGYCDAMVAADEAHLAEQARLDALRLEIEAPAGRLKGKILSLRSTCEGLLGAESLRAFALDFNVAQYPEGVLRQGEIIHGRVLDCEVDLKPKRWIEVSLERATLARELDDEIVVLGPLMGRFVDQRKRVDTAMVRKEKAIEEFDRNFIPLARMLEATFRVAGETELADRIRPTVRQLGRDDGKETQPAEPEATPEPAPDTVEETAPTPAS